MIYDCDKKGGITSWSISIIYKNKTRLTKSMSQRLTNSSQTIWHEESSHLLCRGGVEEAAHPEWGEPLKPQDLIEQSRPDQLTSQHQRVQTEHRTGTPTGQVEGLHIRHLTLADPESALSVRALTLGDAENRTLTHSTGGTRGKMYFCQTAT